jgi:hypothetical protein
LSYMRPEYKYKKPMSLLYKFYYTEYCLYTEDYINSLTEKLRNNPTQQAINRGQHKLLEEIFIVEDHLISSF